MKKILFFALALIALALASCENEKEPPSGAGSFPQITLVNNSPSKAFLSIYNNSKRIADTDMVEPYSSAQAKFRNAFSNAGEDVIIKVYKREDSASDTKIYQQGFKLLVRDKYTFTVDNNYNVSYRPNH